VSLASHQRLAGPARNLAEHHPRPIVSSAPGPNAETLREFFELPGRAQTLDPGSLDRHVPPYIHAIRQCRPEAEIAYDPFHVIAAAGVALDEVRRTESRAKGKSTTPDGRGQNADPGWTSPHSAPRSPPTRM
jgi:transposase